MITYNKKWHYLAVKISDSLFKGIKLNHIGDFYSLNCLHSFKTEKHLKKYENICNNYDYVYTEIPKEDKKVLKYNYE